MVALEGFDFRFGLAFGSAAFGLAFAAGVGLGLASEEFLRLKSDAFAIGVGLEEVPAAFLRLKSDRSGLGALLLNFLVRLTLPFSISFSS